MSVIHAQEVSNLRKIFVRGLVIEKNIFANNIKRKWRYDQKCFIQSK